MRQLQPRVFAICLFALSSLPSSSLATTSHGHLRISFQGQFSSVEELNSARKMTFEAGKTEDLGSICLATKFGEIDDGWRLLHCADITKINNGEYGSVTLAISENKGPLFLFGFGTGSVAASLSDVIYSTVLPPLFPNDDAITPVDMTSKDGITNRQIYVKLTCQQDWYGPRCATHCQPISEYHVCDHVTGEQRCARGWSGPMCSESVFVPRHVASQFVRSRPKRANSFLRFEEFWPGNIERECEEERCSKEEAREAFEDDTLTEQYWIRYMDPNQCIPNPCVRANSYRCEDKLQDYDCHCKPGYKGKNCETVIDVCESGPCRNGALCTMSSPTSFACACAPGFHGHLCDVNIDDCVESVCGIHGICVDGINSYTCECDQGYTGSRCEIEIDECATSPCQNGGNCSDHVAYYTCSCPYEYHGTDCQLRHSPCRSSPCHNGGDCVANPDYSYTCQCRVGFTGSRCQYEVGSPCATEPCSNGGSCYVIMNNVTNEVTYVNATGGANASLEFRCMCSIGYGGPTCEKKISACEYAGDPCPLNSTCVSLDKQYVCVCPVGYTGEYCHVPGEDSEVVTRVKCADDPCLNEARCIFNDNTTMCVCRPGYNGSHCENEINYCASDPCIHGGECVRKPGDFLCNCAQGYHGRYCENDIDECAVAQPCHNNVTCNNTVGSFQCLCGPYLTGRLCEFEFDPCGATPCQHGGTCYHAEEGYECHCVPGYGGWDCQDIIDPCDSMINPCMNGGSCSPLVDDPTQANCTCSAAFYGRYCDKKVDHCVVPGNETRFDPISGNNVSVRIPRSDCGMNGECVSEMFGFRCRCHMGYVGERCDIAFTPPVVNCSLEYCKCPGKLLQKVKTEHNVTSVPCQYKHYDEGVCRPPTCLTPPCGESNASHFCEWKPSCLQQYEHRYMRKDLERSSIVECPVLEMVFNRSRLGQNATLELLCHALRSLSVITRFRKSVTVHCALLDENSENTTIATAMDSVTSEVNAFVLASNLFQRLEEETHHKEDTDAKTVKIKTADLDPFFSYALLKVRFGRHMGHMQDHFDKLVDNTPHPTGQNRKNPVYIGVPVALCLLLLCLLLLFLLVRRRRKEALHITLTHDSDRVNDVIGDTGSVDRVVVLPSKALWSKISWSKNRKRRLASDSFENPLFSDTPHSALTSRPSVVSNAYVGATSPMLTKSCDDVTDNSVEKSTVAYSVHNSPAHTSSSNPEVQEEYTSGDTLPYGAISLIQTNPSPSKTSRSSFQTNPYATVKESPYSLATEPQSISRSPESKQLYSFAAEPAPTQNASPSKSASHGYAEVTRPSSAFTSPVPSANSSPQGSPSRAPSSGCCGSGESPLTSNGESNAPSSGAVEVSTADTRWSRDDNQEHYQTPTSLFPKHDLFFTDRQTELPEVYNVPRKANPVD